MKRNGGLAVAALIGTFFSFSASMNGGTVVTRADVKRVLGCLLFAPLDPF